MSLLDWFTGNLIAACIVKKRSLSRSLSLDVNEPLPFITPLAIPGIPGMYLTSLSVKYESQTVVPLSVQ